jgi:hypothetical protein
MEWNLNLNIFVLNWPTVKLEYHLTSVLTSSTGIPELCISIQSKADIDVKTNGQKRMIYISLLCTNYSVSFSLIDI